MEDQKLNILYPDGTDLSTAKIESAQTATMIFTRVSFPTGLVLEFDQYADHIDVRCNHATRLLPNGDLKIL